MLTLPRRFRRRLKCLLAAMRPWSARYECPVCGHTGRFLAVSPSSGRREAAQCPSCNAMERHRLQYLVLEDLLEPMPCNSMSLLHFAPEPFFREYFSRRFGRYETADILMSEVDHRADLTDLPFPDNSYDLVFASHVLEHISDDHLALQEISRVLKPGGMAVLPVPLVADRTVEYPEPNLHEANHVRAPGYEDYFDRYRAVFSRVELFQSDRFPAKYQVYIYEDRSNFPTARFPLRPPMHGERHIDIVPVCYA